MPDDIYTQLDAFGCKRITVAERYDLNLHYTRFRWHGLDYTLYGTSALDLAKRVGVWLEKKAKEVAA